MPKAGELLLDTNAVIAFLPADPAFTAAVAGRATYLAVTVVGELYYGAFSPARAGENVAKVDRLVAASGALPCDDVTSRDYGRTKRVLKTKGQMIPENDIWIAATSLQCGLTLVTRDGHSEVADGLATVAW